MTEEKRIRYKIYGLLGTTVFIVVTMVVLWLFMLRRPQLAKITQTQADTDAQKAAADKLPTDLAEEQKAKDKARYLKGTLEFFRGSDTDIDQPGRFRRFYFDFGKSTDKPDVQTAKRRDTWKRMLNDRYLDFGEALKAELVRIADESGGAPALTIKTSVKVDAPPNHPEDVTVPPSGFMKPVAGGKLGSVTVDGSLENILDFLDRINRSDILLVIGNVKLAGTTPHVTCTFDIYPYVLAAGPDAPLGGGGGAPAGPAGPAAGQNNNNSG